MLKSLLRIKAKKHTWALINGRVTILKLNKLRLFANDVSMPI